MKVMFLLAVIIWFSPTIRGTTLTFQRDWCRMHSTRLKWRDMVKSCHDNIAWETHKYPETMSTDPTQSYVSYSEIKPAGQISKMYIQSVTGEGLAKGFGGDSWRVRIQGPASLEAPVIDLHNGSYEALFLMMEPGRYNVSVILEYSLCNGFKDPPHDWYKKGDRQGNFQMYDEKDPIEKVRMLPDYIKQPLGVQPIQMNVKPALNPHQELDGLDPYCDSKCSFLWDGFGRWVKQGQTDRYIWNSFIPGVLVKPSGQELSRQLPGRPGTLWIAGDSHSHYWYQGLNMEPLCSRTFAQCGNTYAWIYTMTGNRQLDFNKSEKDINITEVISDFKQILKNPKMNKESALVFNAGVHFSKTTSFSNYATIVKEMVKTLKDYPGKTVWRSTTPIYQQVELYKTTFRRFQTNQRSLLFNSFANAVMCNSGIPILDVYPLTSSYPHPPGSPGTSDPIHYENRAYVPLEAILKEYFSRFVAVPAENSGTEINNGLNRDILTNIYGILSKHKNTADKWAMEHWKKLQNHT